MQDYSFDRPLVMTPTSSFWLNLWVVLSHALVLMFVVLLLNIKLAVTLVLIIMITLSLAYYYQLYISKTLSRSVLYAVHSFHKGQDKGWSVRLSHQKEDLAVTIQSSSFVSNSLIILNFKAHNNKTYSLMIPVDSVTQQVNRQLRVRLKVMS